MLLRKKITIFFHSWHTVEGGCISFPTAAKGGASLAAKRKIARGIVKGRYALMTLLLAATVLSGLAIGKTNINYDLTRYLSDDTMTKRALKVMTEEFSSSEQLRILFVNQTEEQLSRAMAILNALPEVLFSSHDPEKDTLAQDGNAYQLVSLTLNGGDSTETVKLLRQMFPEAGKYYVGGSAASLLDVQSSVAREMPAVMLIAVAVVLLMLLLTSHAFLEPVAILAVLAVSIVLNMGTNFIFPDVSFITFAVSAILQLALSIDYAIMLLHAFNGFRDSGKNARDAMTDALAECFMRISSSALTTVAGLLSLLFMSFTIGFDIGLVLSKGILISMLCVFLLMPAIVILMEKPLQKTRHRPLPLKGEKLAAAICRFKGPLAVLLVLSVVSGLYLNSRNTYTFSGPEGAENSETAFINHLFGESNPLILLVPGGEEDGDYDLQRALVDNLTAITRADGSPAVSGVSSMVTTAAEALRYYTPQEAAALTGQSPALVSLFYLTQGFGSSVRADHLLSAASALMGDNPAVRTMQEQLSAARAAFIGPHFARLAAELTVSPADADFTSVMDAVLAAARAVYGENYYVTGVSMSTYDIAKAFREDLLKVNLITLLAILLIVTVSFRSFRLPLLLVFVIEGAIWITMGISFLRGEPIFFVSYLICLSIQMGATIDYGILLSDQYRSARKKGETPGCAMGGALKKSLPTILTSGVILTVAGAIIGWQCSIYYISSIGLLVSRGALVSALLVLFLLPALLLLGDRFILPVGGKGKA